MVQFLRYSVKCDTLDQVHCQEVLPPNYKGKVSTSQYTERSGLLWTVDGLLISRYDIQIPTH